MSEPNPSQMEAIKARGFVRVDAGPGTGKTETVANRYVDLVDSGVDPRDILLLTFTRNGAAEMKQRLVFRLNSLGINYSPKEIRVSTFDSLCSRILRESTESISRFFDIDDLLFNGAKLVENSSSNKDYFRSTLVSYASRNPDCFTDQLQIAIDNSGSLFELINKLMVYGIVATSDGWFGMDSKNLLGDEDDVWNRLLEKNDIDLVKKINAPSESKFHYNYPDDILSSETTVREERLYEAAFDDRSDLIEAIRRVYFNYIVQSIRDDRLTFSLASTLAFIALFQNEKLRRVFSCDYLMIDEFQDTDCNQLMIGLMLLRSPELFVVGDFRQSIFGFRNTSPEYILKFHEKSVKLAEFLDDKVSITIPEVKDVRLEFNYRSSQRIIDTSYGILKDSDPAEYNYEKIDDSLISFNDSVLDSKIQLVALDGNEDREISQVVAWVKEYVTNPDYTISTSGNRRVRFGDIAILCRNNSIARKIHRKLQEYGYPSFLNGDEAMMNTPEAKLILAWLRYITDPHDEYGISTLLIKKGWHSKDVKEAVLHNRLPEDLIHTRKHLKDCEKRPIKIVTLISEIYDTMDQEVFASILDALETEFEESICTLADLIAFIEENMQDESKFILDKPLDTEAVLIETIHKSKGSEYPVVIIPGVNTSSFPHSNQFKNDEIYSYSGLTGVRCTDEMIHTGTGTYVVKSWKTRLALCSRISSQEEEKRLMFVALSRSKQYITMIASRPSSFFKTIKARKDDVMVVPSLPDGELNIDGLNCQNQIEKRVPKQNFSVKRSMVMVGVHDVIDLTASGASDVEAEHLGMNYGNALHHLAEFTVKGIPLDRTDEFDDLDKEDVIFVTNFIDELKSRGAKLSTEIACRLPFNDYGVTLSGVIDLLAVYESQSGVEIEIYDWKTDADPKMFLKGYTQQLSVYYHAVRNVYPNAKISCFINFVRAKTRESKTRIDPLPLEDLEELVSNWVD